MTPKELQNKMLEKANKIANGRKVSHLTYIDTKTYKNTQEVLFFVEYEDEQCG